MTIPKRHHFLPVFYQEGFTREGFLWLFDRETGKYRREQPINTAVIGHYYTVEDAEGNKRPEIERFLSTSVESDTKPIVQKLDAGDPITEEEKDAFSYFISFLYFRVPRFQRMLDEMIDGAVKALNPFMFQSPEDIGATLREVPGLTDDQRNMPPQLLYDFAMSNQYTVKATKEFRVGMMMDLAVKMQNYFRQMQWLVVHSGRDTSFLTTDAPLVVVPPTDWKPESRFCGFLTPGAKKLLPLTHKSCLIMADHGKEVVHGSFGKEQVRWTNKFVVADCERFVIGRDEAHVRSLVQKTRVDRSAREPLVHVG